MTAIAYRAGIMAADTLTVGASVVRGYDRKLARSPGGSIAGCAGHAGWCAQFRRWVADGKIDQWIAGGFATKLEFQPGEQEFGAIVVEQNGKVICVDWHGNAITGMTAPFYADGSATEILIGAMAHGATAEEAVRIAIQYDTGCGGEVQVERLL